MGRLSVEVICAWRDRQDIVPIRLEAGATALDAVRASGLLNRYPEIDPGEPMIGIFGRRAAPGTRLKDGDRVEIYRPLEVDPKESRRARATATQRPKRRAG